MPRDRTSRLIAAILRISASLDLATVLKEIVDSARELAGARYGVITTVNEAGEVEEFVSSGFTPEEYRQLANWPDGPRLFRHLREIDASLSLRDLPSYVRELGFSSDLMRFKTLQVMPMRHHGEDIGSFFLAGMEAEREFSAADEEILVLFASQAAAAITNARTHQDMERAREKLETLVETSPLGIVAFDAATGDPVSFNREALRIVESLGAAGDPPEQLLGEITCRPPCGREVSLGELPLAEQFESATTLRAREVELSAPDGRSIRTLIDVTPIRSGDGEIVSVVVTIQDLAPLEELERQRAEFLRMVSHELRAPLTSIKGSTATVLGGAALPAQSELLQFFRIIDGQADLMYRLVTNLLDAGSIDAGTLTVAPEPSDLGTLIDQARNTFLSSGGRHAVLIDLPRGLPWAMADGERIVQVLSNLLSNAARHSQPSSSIRVEAKREGPRIAVSVSDEGQGIPPEQLPHLFRRQGNLGGGDRGGVIEGTGLGLTICKGLVEAHGGRIWAESGGVGHGARFTFTIPAATEATPTEATPSDGEPRGCPSPSRNGGRKTPILVVDDDPHTLRYVRDTLSRAGYAVVVTGDPDELSRLIRTEKPRLVLLDLMLPGIDGIRLMERVPQLATLPVIFISGYRGDETIAKALEIGAADYIVKPFSPTELVARVRAVLRARADPEAFVLGEFAIDYDRRRVSVGNRRIALTATEFRLLRILSRQAGQVVTTRALLREVWGRRDSRTTDRVRTIVKTLRAKLGDDADKPTYIFNERGVGYRMASSAIVENAAAIPGDGSGERSGGGSL